MAVYPSLDQYNDAVQHPRTAFTDPLLKSGTVDVGGLGLPLALGGGFALTYGVTSGGRKYAVRCFHKEAAHLERRYAQISAVVANEGSGTFVGFEYQTRGILVNGSLFPIVRMEWAAGNTLGSYLEKNYTDAAKIRALCDRFRALNRYLSSKGLAHGDIQNGNLIVNGLLRLIDYDGMFVPSMTVGDGTEIGHKHFQHPKRSKKSFGPDMDRFSFILVNLSLRLIEARASLFKKHSNGENIIFSASDLNDPLQSAVFGDATKIGSCKRDVENFIKICRAPLEQVPALEDFLAGRNIPVARTDERLLRPGAPRSQPVYVGAFDVVDGTDYAFVEKYVGERVEMIGQITDVREGRTRRAKPYLFINFGNWRGRIAKITIWSGGLENLNTKPDASWKHKWVSVTGLVDPPYTNRRLKYTHLSITVTEPNQLHIISAEEARRRLGGTGSGATTATNAERSTRPSNQEILDAVRTRPGGDRPVRRGCSPPRRVPTRTLKSTSTNSANKKILEKIRGSSAHSPRPRLSRTGTPTPIHQQRKSSGLGRWLLWMIGGLIVIWVLFLR